MASAPNGKRKDEMGVSMIKVGKINFRIAEEKDVFALMQLYQIGKPPFVSDSLFLDAEKLKEGLRSPFSAWIVGEKENSILCVFSMLIDGENRLAKVNRLYMDPSIEDWPTLLKKGLVPLTEYLRDPKRQVEVIYTTAQGVTLKQQEATLDLGFKIVGVLPMAAGSEGSKLNGVAAFFYEGVLREKRQQEFSLHPVIAPFYEIARRECQLESLPVAKELPPNPSHFEELPSLELIHAPQFVLKRFSKLEERKSLAMHFYPFTRPNAMIVDEDETVEIYVKIIQEEQMATIIGERLEKAVNPTELYSQVARMLGKEKITYIEVINDAADLWGIDCFVKAGYLPCTYFPCLKAQGDKRRDYVVLARSSERLFSNSAMPIAVNKTYLEYLAEYHKLEGRDYLSKFKAR
jgi:hypothetical protein